MTINSPNNPFAILAQVMPRAGSMEEMVSLAAQLAPPPPADYQPSALPTQPPSAGLPQGVGPQVAGPQQPAPIMPPKTQGENRTSIGQHLVGG